eukprot:2073877-Rhodomonas_salina.1
MATDCERIRHQVLFPSYPQTSRHTSAPAQPLLSAQPACNPPAARPHAIPAKCTRRSYTVLIHLCGYRGVGHGQ